MKRPRPRPLLVVAVVAVVAALFLQLALSNHHAVSGAMLPAVFVGERFFALSSFGAASPAAGDVVMFVAPEWVPRNAGDTWLSRVIARGGQRIQLLDGVVHVDGAPLPLSDGAPVAYGTLDERPGGGRWIEERALRRDEAIGGRAHAVYFDEERAATQEPWPNASAPWPAARGLTGCASGACTVDDGYVFVLGDNRDHASDSRVWGGVPVDNIVGTALFVWWSTDRDGVRWDRMFRTIR